MKLKFLAPALAATLAITVVAAAAPVSAGTKDYIKICSNPRLSLVERAACKSEMLAATTDEARTYLFHVYDLKTIGYEIDGSRIKSVQEAVLK